MTRSIRFKIYQKKPIFWIALLCDSVFILSLLLQYSIWTEACLLCHIQRWSWFFLGLFCHGKQWGIRRGMVVGMIASISINALSALRQLYLQHVDQQANCLPDFWFFWETGQWSAGFKSLFTQNCASSPVLFDTLSLATLNLCLTVSISILLYNALKKHEPALHHP